MPSPLTVYRASAGSGKTFRLAVEYIKLLVRNPLNYRRILAVTFTNKATEEMKMRILSQLYGIAHGLDDSAPYLNCVTTELGIAAATARSQAAVALSLLLHNYHYFHVETIDTFFQRVLRNLARELDLTANLRVELNDRQVEDQAVDVLIAGLDQRSVQLQWIMDFIRQNIEDDKSWNVIKSIKDFGTNIFKDTYKEHARALEKNMAAPHFFEQLSRQLNAIVTHTRETFSQACRDFQSILDRYQMSVTEFSNGERGASGYFVKLGKGKYSDKDLLTKRVCDAMDDPATMVKAGSAAYVRDAAADVAALITRMEAERPSLLRAYNSALVTRRHLSQLRLLRSIEQTVRELNSEANRFLLSDTQSMLSELIEDSDSPFVFEKIGVRLEHIMIDEFQDTSRIQWKNFKVLLNESMSHTENRADGVSANLIVGDVKQSIYRWRDGDWRLLNGIEAEFPRGSVDTEPLNVNRRSAARIIGFNNAFFLSASAAEQAHLAEEVGEDRAAEVAAAYGDLVQHTAEQTPRGGYVRVELLPKTDDYHEQMFQRLEDILRALIEERHIAPGKIVILVRANRTIQEIADRLSIDMPQVKLVSDEAFRLDASAAVNVLVDALRVVSAPMDLLAAAELATLWHTQVLGDAGFLSELAITRADDESVSHIDKQTHARAVNRMLGYLPAAFATRLPQLRSMPLYDLAEEVFRLFGLQQLDAQAAYVCAFYDQLTAFLDNTTGDIADFLASWDDTLCRKTIQCDQPDGVRLTTIHKSKGLEYDHVVMPFCDWRLELPGYTLWTQPKEPPYSELGAVPVDYYGSQLKGSIYEDDYKEEHLQNTMDNLNMLYVAFTRAKSSLWVLGRKEATGTRSKLIEDCLDDVAGRLDGSQYDAGEADSPTVFTYGEPPVPVVKARKASANAFLRPADDEAVAVRTFPKSVSFIQSNDSKEFLQEGTEEERRRSYINTGDILHRIFSTIRTADDIAPAMRQLQQDGLLYDSHVTEADVAGWLHKALQNPVVADWFSPRWQLFNECTILCYHPEDGELEDRRPDRVMLGDDGIVVVDYKFGRKRPAHARQVARYMQMLTDMGYANVKGYLWYVMLGDVEPVALTAAHS